MYKAAVCRMHEVALLQLLHLALELESTTLQRGEGMKFFVRPVGECGAASVQRACYRKRVCGFCRQGRLSCNKVLAPACCPLANMTQWDEPRQNCSPAVIMVLLVLFWDDRYRQLGAGCNMLQGR